ncbi:Ger(x)C family spore germination protein [Alicyclobacillus tolerans]|uniref:Ger(X)C family germination protein n=1 Tax=Alicyclobacillus tolerans TaxID=90970 RepID=A0ABT9LVS7_9BACL|nr:Ger(x)C family spore germination protein [Alicyclobacillus tengchongensis]MDP9728373.1 Ger(x)C family germination protein [Alicyclobacillus tengchongensis]
MWKNKIKRGLAVFWMCAASLSMSGCYDRQELEQQAFITTLGLDKAPDGMVDCTFRVAVPKNPSSASGPGQEDDRSNGPITIRARSVNEAMLIANTSLERNATFSHLGTIIFGKTLAQNGILPYLQPLLRFREFRQTVTVVVSKSTARDVIQNFKPMLEQSAGRIGDSVAGVGRRTGLFPVTYLHDLSSAIQSPHEDILTPLYGVNKITEKSDASSSQESNGGEKDSFSGTNKSQEKLTPPLGKKKMSFAAGEIARTGGNPVDFAGAAVFRGDKVVDFLDARQAILYQLLHGGLRNAKFDFTDKSGKFQDIGITLHTERPPSYHIKLGNPVFIRVSLPMDADVINIQSGRNYLSYSGQRHLESFLDKQLDTECQSLLERLLIRDGSDCIPVSRYIRPQFLTDQAFNQYPWEKNLRHARIQVDSQLHVRRFGIQMEPVENR